VAACIGREFDLGLLQAACERPETVVPALDKLVAAELVFQRRDKNKPQFAFKHALVQEAAYESVLRGKRHKVHARILAALEGSGGGAALEVLARHAACAEQHDKAIHYGTRAAQEALEKSAYREAIRHFETALKLLQSCDPATDRTAQELLLQLGLGRCHTGMNGYGSDGAGQAFARAHVLLQSQPGTEMQRLYAHYGLWLWHLSRGKLQEALRLAADALAAEQAQGTRESALWMHRLVGLTLCCLGDFARARGHCELATSIEASERRDEMTAHIGFDVALSARLTLSWLLCLQGQVAQSGEAMASAHALLNAHTRVHMRGHVHLSAALRAVLLRQRALAVAETEALAELAGRHRLWMYQGYVEALRGWADMEAGHAPEQAIARYEAGLRQLDASHARTYEPLFAAWLALALADAGRHEEAARTIDTALAQCEDRSLGWCEAEIWRLRGEVFVRAGPAHGARAGQCLREAVARARAREARLWELRATVSLARFEAGQDRHAPAVQRLAALCGSFGDGIEMADLVDAKALLGQRGPASATVQADAPS
jgi:tetratricopeptide (TPR) repeat protein